MPKAEHTDEERTADESPRAARVLSLYPQVTLARVTEPGPDGSWVLAVGRRRMIAEVDPSVDPRLVERALEDDSRVVVEIDDIARIVGTLQTRRAIEIDREGRVAAEVERFSLHAAEEVLLRTPGAFVRLETHKVEAYATRVLARGRETVRLLAAMVKLN